VRIVPKRSSAVRRRWADIVIIAASVYAIAAATQMPLELATGDVDEAVRFALWLPTAYVLGGILGAASIFIALRWPGAARLVVVAAAIVLLSGLLALHGFAWLPVLSLGLPAIAMLGAAPFMGTMPRPEEEEAEKRTAR
jgi:hypothetical protein